MKRAILAMASAVAVALSLAACDQQAAPVAAYQAPPAVVAAPAPVVVQNSAADFAAGMMIGHALSGPTIVHHYYSAPRPVYRYRSTVVMRSYSYRRR